MGTLVEITDFDLLIVPALGAGERSYLSRTVRRNDGSLVPVEDVAARLAPLPEGDDRAALVDYLSACHLYRHLAELLARAGLSAATVELPPEEPAPERASRVCGRRRPVAWLAESG
jgi:hypothetical protein